MVFDHLSHKVGLFALNCSLTTSFTKLELLRSSFYLNFNGQLGTNSSVDFEGIVGTALYSNKVSKVSKMLHFNFLHCFVSSKICEFHRTGQIQIQIFQLQKESKEDENLFFKKLLETSGKAGREKEINKLLTEQDWIKQTINILNEN